MRGCWSASHHARENASVVRGSSGTWLCTNWFHAARAVWPLPDSVGNKIVYLFMIVYTLGTLTIYAVAVPQALQTLLPSSTKVLGLDPYYLFLIGFAIIAFPFCFGNFQNTKYLQITVMVFRFLCFVCMIWASVAHIARGKGADSHLVVENDVKMPGLPWMLGNAICTFMMHHSIPGLVKPVRPQLSIKSAMLVGSCMGLFAYLSLCLTAVFAFGINVNVRRRGCCLFGDRGCSSDR